MTGRRVELAALSAGVFLWILDALIVTVALADLKRDLGLSAAEVQWVVDAYAVSLASLLLAAGALADRVGPRLVYMVGLGSFAAASAACGAAPSSAVLIASRALQGAAAAALLPSSLALLRSMFPDNAERARAIGVWAAASGIAGVLGPPLGGVLVQAGGWRLAFLVNVPLCAVGSLLAMRLPAATVPARRRSFEPAAHGALAVALAAVVCLVIELPHRALGSPPLLAAVAIAAIATARLATAASRAALLPERFFASRTVRTTAGVALLHNFAGYGVVFVLSLYLQLGRGWSPLVTGLALVPMPLTMTVTSPASGRLVRRVGARTLLGAGMAIGAGCSLCLAWLSDGTPYAAVGAAVAGMGLASGLSVPAMTAVMLVAVPEEHAGVAGAVLTAARQIGTALGVAVVGAVVAAAGTFEDGIPRGMVIAAAAFAVGSALSVGYVRRLRPTGDAAPVVAPARGPSGGLTGRP
jgi:DHA2 family methylenomycin A resistance protein-like MFS transporter